MATHIANIRRTAHLSGHDLLGLDFVVVHREHERRLLGLGELQRTVAAYSVGMLLNATGAAEARRGLNSRPLRRQWCCAASGAGERQRAVMGCAGVHRRVVVGGVCLGLKGVCLRGCVCVCV